MKISELIRQLEGFKNEYGDLEVYVHSFYGEADKMESIKKEELIYGTSESTYSNGDCCLLTSQDKQ